jgi:hypothetical protein
MLDLLISGAQKVIVDQQRLLGATTDGQLIPRRIDPVVLRRPVC